MDRAFFSYAIAHGFQYIVFISVVSVSMGMSEGRRGVSGSMAAAAALIVLIGIVGACSADLKEIEWIRSSAIVAGSIDFAAGIGIGATIAHFVIDAGAWRLSRPSVRGYMTKRFGFVLKEAGAGARGLTASRVPLTPI
jgi:hypothetical protein